MKKKGFTLIELLAVIVILTIIALIAIPLIGNVIEKAKIGALENSVNGLVESANMYYANQSIKGEQATETIFDFNNGEQISIEKLEYKGKVYNGKLILHANGKIAVCIDDKEHYAYKNKDNDEIVSGIGTCLYDGTTGDFSSNSSIKDLRGKTVVAANIIESDDGLNAIIRIPEEGHYNETSQISVLNSNLSNVKQGTFTATYNQLYVVDLGFKPDFIIMNSTDNKIYYQYNNKVSETLYYLNNAGTVYSANIGSVINTFNTLGLNDTGFTFKRTWTDKLTYNYIAGKF